MVKTFRNQKDDSTHGNDWMDNTKIKLIIYFANKDGALLFSELQIVLQITNFIY